MTRAKQNRKSVPRSTTAELADTRPALASKAAYPFWAFPILLVFLTCISFLPVMQNGFLSWDDEATLVKNLTYRGLGWRQIQWMFSTFYLWRLRSVWPAGLASWIYYLLLLGPVLGFAQSGLQLVADRYSYLSCLSWAVLAGAGLVYVCNAWLSGRIPKGSRDCALAAAAMVTVLLGALTWPQVQVWHDSERLWSRVLAVTPRSSFAQNNLGNIRSKRGELDDATKRFQYALEINPRFAEAQYNLAAIAYTRGDFDQALRHYEEALRLRPNYAQAHYNLGVTLDKLGRSTEAARHYREALRIQPGFAAARENLNQLLQHQR